MHYCIVCAETHYKLAFLSSKRSNSLNTWSRSGAGSSSTLSESIGAPSVEEGEPPAIATAVTSAVALL